MNNGWIKLHRKVQESPIWQDQNAWRVFQWILLNVDFETGVGTFGKKQISEGTGIKLGTIYKVVTRLQKKYSVLSTKSSQSYTQISVLNWAKYQHSSDEVVSTVQETQSGAYKKGSPIIRNKEIKNKEIYITPFLEKFNAIFGSSYRPTKTRSEKLLQRLKSYSFDEVSFALDNMASDPFYKGKNDRNWKADPDFFLRTDEQIDKFLNKNTKPTKSFIDEIMTLKEQAKI